MQLILFFIFTFYFWQALAHPYFSLTRQQTCLECHSQPNGQGLLKIDLNLKIPQLVPWLRIGGKTQVEQYFFKSDLEDKAAATVKHVQLQFLGQYKVNSITVEPHFALDRFTPASPERPEDFIYSPYSFVRFEYEEGILNQKIIFKSGYFNTELQMLFVAAPDVYYQNEFGFSWKTSTQTSKVSLAKTDKLKTYTVTNSLNSYWIQYNIELIDGDQYTLGYFVESPSDYKTLMASVQKKINAKSFISFFGFSKKQSNSGDAVGVKIKPTFEAQDYFFVSPFFSYQNANIKQSRKIITYGLEVYKTILSQLGFKISYDQTRNETTDDVRSEKLTLDAVFYF